MKTGKPLSEFGLCGHRIVLLGILYRIKELAASDAEWETSPLPLVPDLAVEVMSPTDRFAALSQKARRYLSDGVQQVWVVDPERRAVFVYVSDSIIPLSEEDKLSAKIS